MLDDFLREDDDPNSFLDKVEEAPSVEAPSSGTPTLDLPEEPATGFLGMTPGQRFIISVMFFIMVLIIGAFCLLITGSIGIPLR